MLLFVIVVWVLSSDLGARNRARSKTKALGARDLSPPARLLTTEIFSDHHNLKAKSRSFKNTIADFPPSFPSVSDG